jgi:phage replication-related protein YjqB (UPF0714/DUF867 family)
MLKRRRTEIETAYTAYFTPNNERITEHPRREHCSANSNQIRMIGLSSGQQVRIERPTENGTIFALYTIDAYDNEKEPGNAVYVGYTKPEDLRDRLGLSGIISFKGKINAQVTALGLDDDEAEVYNEFIEHLADNDQNRGLIIIAPHGGNIEEHTDEQAEYVYEKLLSSKRVSLWICKGFNKKEQGGAFNRWHITSTDISKESFPKLNTVFGRGFEYAIAFHGFEDDNDKKSICIGGKTVDANLKKEIKEQIEAAVRRFQIDVYMDGNCPNQNNGNHENNIVNRLSKNGLQIEQSKKVRTMHDEENHPLRFIIADAVSKVMRRKLTV